MSSRAHRLLATVLITGALAASSACSSKNSNTGAASPTNAASTGTTTPDSGLPATSGTVSAASSSSTASATTGAATTPADSGQVNQLPDPGSKLTLAAVGKDNFDLPTAFYRWNNPGDNTAAVEAYVAGLKQAGYRVTQAQQDNESVHGVYKAQKGDLAITVDSATAFTAQGAMLLVQVDSHGSGFTMPSAPPSSGLETSVLATEGNLKFFAVGGDVAFYGFFNGDFDSYLAAVKAAGYQVAPLKQDNETVKNAYTATKQGRNLELERSHSWTTEDLLVVTSISS